MSGNRLDGKCGACGHVFLVAHLPMELTKVVRLAKRAGCPACGEIRDIRVTRLASDGGDVQTEKATAQ